MEDLLKKIFLVEIIKGLTLTFKRFLSKPVTRRYPKEKRIVKPGFRGLHALVRDPKTGKARCVGCGLCAAICPSRCIYIYTSEGENHEKNVDRYEIELLRCLYCSYCMEACPFQAVVLTEHYEYSGYTRDELYMTKEQLLENWDRYMEGEKGRIYFERFWGPKVESFGTPKEQALFKLKGQ